MLTWATFLFTTAVYAASTEYGLTGFPASSYDPTCATACLRSFSMLTLNCSSEGATVGMVTFQTSTECYATNAAFLTSVAWCAHTKCADYAPSASLMEYWWYMQITGQRSAGAPAVPAKWTYGEALAQVDTPPTVQLDAMDTSLNTTSLAAPDVYEPQYNVLSSIHREGTVENAYGYVQPDLPDVCPIKAHTVKYRYVSDRLWTANCPDVAWLLPLGLSSHRPSSTIPNLAEHGGKIPRTIVALHDRKSTTCRPCSLHCFDGSPQHCLHIHQLRVETAKPLEPDNAP